jgi:hypothetical protein
MNTMKFVVVVVLFALIGSASAAISQTDCATLSAYMRCQPEAVGSTEADCDTSNCKWSSGGGCSASDATMTKVGALGAAGSGWATVEAEKLALCKAEPNCWIYFTHPQTICQPHNTPTECLPSLNSYCTQGKWGNETCQLYNQYAHSDDCINSGFMTTDYRVSGASSIMASTVILAFIAAGLATFA